MPVQAEGTAVWTASGWKVVVAENDWPQRLSDELANRSAQEDIQQEIQK
jgi:hypothetical protein